MEKAVGSFQLHFSRVASAYFFPGSILIEVGVHTDREKVSTKPLVILIKALKCNFTQLEL